MSVSSQDMFGGAPAAQAAIPGSYGMAPTGFRLPASLRLGAVRLQVSHLERSMHWYQQVLGLCELLRDSQSIHLGVSGAQEPLVILEHRPGTVPVRPGSRVGLYHFAILLPDRPSLGKLVKHLAKLGVRAGSSDHLVSEALYLQDPDGLGIEVYRDRPRDEWQRIGQELMMATDPLDVQSLMASAAGEPWQGMPQGTVMGHLHLHVGDIPRAAEFYSRALGFDKMVWRYPGALFLGAGGYHHHLATNTWAQTASSPGALDAQLLEWSLVVPSPSEVLDSLHSAGFPAQDGVVHDPWGTPLRIR